MKKKKFLMKNPKIDDLISEILSELGKFLDRQQCEKDSHKLCLKFSEWFSTYIKETIFEHYKKMVKYEIYKVLKEVQSKVGHCVVGEYMYKYSNNTCCIGMKNALNGKHVEYDYKTNFGDDYYHIKGVKIFYCPYCGEELYGK